MWWKQQRSRTAADRCVEADWPESRYCRNSLPASDDSGSQPGSWRVISDRIKRSLLCVDHEALAHASVSRCVSDTIRHRIDMEKQSDGKSVSRHHLVGKFEPLQATCANARPHFHPWALTTSSGFLRRNLIRRRESGSNAGGVAVRREPLSVKVLRMAATCCFWQRRHKEAAQRLKQRGDLKSLTETVATDLACQKKQKQLTQMSVPLG